MEKREKDTGKKAGSVLVLRTVAANLKSYGGFTWPRKGKVEAKDWDSNPNRDCGRGLHGLLWGEGCGELLNWDKDALWQVVRVKETDMVVPQNRQKVRFHRGVVVYTGDRKTATDMVMKARIGAVVGAVSTAGDRGTATAGDRGTATAGYFGTATAGYFGTATAGDRGTATAGYFGTATAGDRGTATAGKAGFVSILWYDPAQAEYHRVVGAVGDKGLEPGKKYKLNDAHEFEEVKEEAKS